MVVDRPAAKNAGWVIGRDIETSLREFFQSITAQQWQARQADCSSLPDSTFCGEADYDRLSERLAGGA
jgi:hypothetical protein